MAAVNRFCESVPLNALVVTELSKSIDWPENGVRGSQSAINTQRRYATPKGTSEAFVGDLTCPVSALIRS